MAENHYVDPVDQHTVAEGVPDHSDLTTFYAEAKVENLGPWMQEADRQKALGDERNKIQTGLRKSSVLIGLSISLPVVFGILIGQFAMTNTTIADGITAAFVLAGLGVVVLLLTFLLLKWVGARFQKHSVRALPITLTTLLSLFLVTQKVFDYSNKIVGGIIGYAAALGSLVVIGIVIATILIFTWTSPKLPALLKMVALLLFLGAAAYIYYLL
ncbi:MAG TPA: hypothetical protein VIM37_03615 [Candidatus Microsaccharimonas sp.]|jgi:hypothetical protein